VEGNAEYKLKDMCMDRNSRAMDDNEVALITAAFKNDLNAACDSIIDQLGPGHTETVYNKALVAMIRSKGYLVEHEKTFLVSIVDFKGVRHTVSHMKADVIVYATTKSVILLELKCSDKASECNGGEQLNRYKLALQHEGIDLVACYLVTFPRYCWNRSTKNTCKTCTVVDMLPELTTSPCSSTT